MSLDSFATEVAKYDRGVHFLFPGASPESLDRAEQVLSCEFPRTYRAFLARWNGGLLFAKEFGDLDIWSVKGGDEVADQQSPLDVVVDNQFLVREQGHPRNLLAIASHSDGNLICLDLGSDGRPIYWNRDKRTIELEWESLEDWLTHEMQQGKDLYDYHGDERDTPGTVHDINPDEIVPRNFHDPHGR